MRSIFKPLNNSLPLVVFMCCAAVAIQGQAMRDVRVISARAGGVNFVSGDVRVRLRDGSGWETLTNKKTLASGDAVMTGADAQVEVLLNPGSYFRLGANSEFMLVDDSLDKLRLSLTKGSGIIEATGFSELRVSILVDTPQTRVEIVRSGIYRINVRQPNSTEVAVHKGRALVGREPALTLKGGRTARIVGVGVEVAKLDKKEKDAFDLWSRERAQLLAKANGKLSSRNVNAVLASVNNNYWSGFSSGVWYLDAGLGCYVFIPGGYGWSSPYGFYYNHNFFGPGRICNRCNSLLLDSRDWGGAITNNGPNNGGGGGRNRSAREHRSYPSKESPVFRPAPALGKSPDKMNRDQ
ncbi:MAG TPA: FecR family protein [Pyrinomonadaceae bacterium]